VVLRGRPRIGVRVTLRLDPAVEGPAFVVTVARIDVKGEEEQVVTEATTTVAAPGSDVSRAVIAEPQQVVEVVAPMDPARASRRWPARRSGAPERGDAHAARRGLDELLAHNYRHAERHVGSAHFAHVPPMPGSNLLDCAAAQRRHVAGVAGDVRR
jgi:hypothetical protein